jgi:aminoglycoside 3-N-acetyltransferase
MISNLIVQMGTGPIFVHSDPFRAARMVKATRDRGAYLDSHIAVMREAAHGRPLWLPTFNYDFPRTRIFDVLNSQSQLGPIPERFRTTHAEWRTSIPIFSVAGTGFDPHPRWGSMTDPFGDDSIFSQLVGRDGAVLYYGDTFHYNTLVHYAERVAGGPVYRYDKVFSGDVIDAAGNIMPGSLDYHVRPLGMGLDYDWPRLKQEAIAAGVCRADETRPEILAASARLLCELWVANLKEDPFALLDSASRAWAEPAVQKLGRRLSIDDYEPQQAEMTQ